MNIKPGKQFSAEEFKNTPMEYNVCYCWTWNAPITRDGINSQLADFERAGIRSLYVLPLPKDFRSERLRTFLDPEYLSEEFFDLVEYAIREASKKGMEVWIYDEGGWPSGGACYNTVREDKSVVMKLLAEREITLQCDERYHPCDDSVALFNGKHRLPDDYIAAREIHLTEYYIKKKIESGNRVDNTSKTGTDTFIKNTYEKYKERVGDLFGEKLPLFFTDEPGLLRESIAEDEFEIFKEEYGYDLRDYVYVVLDGGARAESEEEIRARIDHITLLGKLFRENTCRKLEKWCEKNGVYYSGHLDLDNRPWGAMAKGYFSHVDLLRRFQVPGIDVIWEQIRMPRDGGLPVDDETKGMGFFPRFAPSAARQEGHNLALTETFSIYGDGITQDEMRYALNYQAVRGINVFNVLAIPYGTARCAALMMRPAFRPEKPGFFNLRSLNEYFGRLSYLTRLGYAEGDTALYHPCRDYCASEIVCDEATAAFKVAGTALEDRGVSFDIIDDYGIRDAEVTPDGLKLGDALYRHVKMTPAKYTPDDVLAKVQPFLGEGEPMLTFESKSLRLMTRKLDTGRLYFIFNEGESAVTEKVEIECEHLYLLDMQSGEMLDYSGEISLLSGDIAVIFATDEKYPTASREVAEEYTLGGFEAVSYKRFNIDYFGIGMKECEGAPVIDEGFSGEVTYRAEYSLPRAPKKGEKYMLLLEGFSASAEVRIGGERYSFGLSPMQTVIDGASLKKSGTVEIDVANTPANEILAKLDVFTSHPVAEVGTYNPKTTAFEARRAPLTFGEVKLKKLK